MTELVIARPAAPSVVKDLIELAKPRITLMVVLTAAIGLRLAPESLTPPRSLAFLAAMALLVASANTLNCWLERSSDALMRRTRQRALPSGRLEPRTAWIVGLAELVVSIPILAIAANPLTALLGAAAHAIYVFVYTPLKRYSSISLLVGAVPGALPPLLGWTAATGMATTPGWALFGILFFWQIPHFIGIALLLEDDYRRAGLRVLTVEAGSRAARWALFASTWPLAALSVSPAALGLAGAGYLIAALASSAVFVALAVLGLRERSGLVWARRTFFFSLVHLTVLLGALFIDAR
jgi:protoheme IX farnesyltransferase